MNKIKKLNEEIQNLQFENLRLLDKSNEQDKINQAGFMDMQKITEENNKYKSEIETLNNELKSTRLKFENNRGILQRQNYTPNNIKGNSNYNSIFNNVKYI